MVQLELQSNYHQCKLEVFDVIPVSSGSLIALCNTYNIPPDMEPAIIRKSVSHETLNDYMRRKVEGNLKGPHHGNLDSAALCKTIAEMINEEENRTEIYCQEVPVHMLCDWKSQPLYNNQWDDNFRLVQIN